MLRQRVLPALLRRSVSRLDVDDDTVAQALRTRAGVRIGGDWVWPHWLDRQLDPDSSAFVPLGDLPFLGNVTRRNWTAVGSLDAPRLAVVDPRGLVTPWFAGWSLDWWIGADDRWHVPSREIAVRQSLVDASPVVETAMRIPGGDAVQRVYGMHRSSTEGGGDLVVVEVENRSKVPVALALSVRPYNPEGLSVVRHINLHDLTVRVDGQVAMVLPKAPSASAASTFRDGDSARTVLDGDAGTGWPGPVRCPDGLAQAAFVFPLAHGATLRCVIPAVPQAPPRRRLTGDRTGPSSLLSYPAAVPAASDVAKGWGVQADRGARLELPDARLAEAVQANRRFLLLLHDGDRIVSGPAAGDRFRFRDAAQLLNALDLYGYHDEAAGVLASYPDRQTTDGYFLGQPREWDANGAALWALGQHLRLTGDRQLIEAMVGPVAKAVHWIERTRQGRAGVGRLGLRRPRDGGRPGGLLPAGASAEPLGPVDCHYRDNFWAVAGLRAGAEMLAAIDQPEAAEDAARFARAMWADLEGSLARDAERLGTRAVPAGPERRMDPGVVEALVACWPLGLMAADDERIAATAAVVRERFTSADDEAFFDRSSHTGLGPCLTMRLAGVELAAGDPMGLDRLGWFLDAASATWTWPEAVHPRLDGGCSGDGHDGRAAAELLRFVRQLLVRETVDGLALSSLVPDSWLGQGWEVHDAPTAHGALSYAVRWHGERPALLWELVPAEGDAATDPAAEPIRLTVPGLDPSWSTTERKGEALLAPVEPRNPPPPVSPTSAPVSFG